MKSPDSTCCERCKNGPDGYCAWNGDLKPLCPCHSKTTADFWPSSVGDAILDTLKKTEPQEAPEWEEEFAAKFPILCAPLKDREGFSGEKVAVANYIRTNFLPLSTLHTLEEKIRGMEKEYPILGAQFYDAAMQEHYHSGFNDAIDSMLQEIRKIINNKMGV